MMHKIWSISTFLQTISGGIVNVYVFGQRFALFGIGNPFAGHLNSLSDIVLQV